MITYELKNHQRMYFGLSLVSDDWIKYKLNNSVSIYYEGDKIVKVLKYDHGYLEYDTHIETRLRRLILPKTPKGKEHKLSVPNILNRKGSGIQFSGSFQGGGIHVYDNWRNLFFIKSFPEDGDIGSFSDIDKWIINYINNSHADYFDWLKKELSQKRLKIKIKEGNIIAFKISRNQCGFARILVDVFAQRQKDDFVSQNLYRFHPKSLIIAPYAYYADTLQIDTENLVNKKTLPALCIFDLEVYRGEMPIIGHIPLSIKERLIPFPDKPETLFAIPYSKTEIESFISTCATENN